ncbi:MAG: ACT domain-containing protein [Bacteroidales bacterium]|nr:ACT domain-containing protein [Bacteroidales bacterium]
MIVKSFVLRRDNYQAIVSLIDDNTIAVVRPEKFVERLFRSLIESVIVRKEDGRQDLATLLDYFRAVSDNPLYLEKVAEFEVQVHSYLSEGMFVYAPLKSVEDYLLAKCARLCADGVACGVPGSSVVDGTGFVVCREPEPGRKPVFDWARSREAIALRCKGSGRLIVSGGYGRLESGYVVRIGRGGSNMLASLIASALGAERVEFYIEADGLDGRAAVTFDEAAHFCAGSSAPFASSALWPAKNAGIPVVVRNIFNPVFAGTVISDSAVSHDGAVSGVMVDEDLALVTVYGTGLLGSVGISSSIMGCLGAAGVNIRFIAQTSSEYSISFAIPSADASRATAALEALVADNPLMPLDDVMLFNRSVGIVTVYGSRIKNVPGVSGKVFGLLGSAGVNVIASAQGGEELSISVVVDASDVSRALAALKAL